MAKKDIGVDGNFTPFARKKIYSYIQMAEIEREKGKANRVNKDKSKGPKMFLKDLLDKGYPEEEAIKALIKNFDNLKAEKIIIEGWIKDINKEIESERSSKEVVVVDGR